MKILFALVLCTVIAAFPAFAGEKGKNGKHLPPGLHKKLVRTGELPPGWQKKLMQGQVLDDDLYEVGRRRIVRPGDYGLQPMVGTELLRLEDRIIRIKNDTRVVLEIFGIKTNY